MKRVLLITLLMNLLFINSKSQIRNPQKAKKAKGKTGIAKIPQYTGNQGTFMWSHYDVTKRSSIVYVSPDGSVRMLSENPPDGAIQSITEITAKVKDIKGVGSVEAALKTQQMIAEMGKRTAAVNMLRDALYRVNEMYYASLDERKQLVNKLFNKFEYTSEKKKDSTIYTFNEELFDKIGSNNGLLYKEKFPVETLKTLYTTILTTIEQVSKAEAEADKESEKTKQKEAENQKSINDAKLLKEQQFLAILSKVEGTITEEKLKELLQAKEKL